MESIQFEFIVQPDYICYGVKAHYFKVSGIVCHRNGNGGMYWDVFCFYGCLADSSRADG